MAKDEIITGLENAVERGESLQSAMQSLISAGYSYADVQEAARAINMGNIGKISDQKIEPQQTQQVKTPPIVIAAVPVKQLSSNSYIQQQNMQVQNQAVHEQNMQTIQPEHKKKFPIMLIVLILVLLLLIGGLILTVMFGDKILATLFPSQL